MVECVTVALSHILTSYVTSYVAAWNLFVLCNREQKNSSNRSLVRLNQNEQFDIFYKKLYRGRENEFTRKQSYSSSTTVWSEA